MKIGYPCINWTIGCKGDKTFRLKSYSEPRLIDTVSNNLGCLSDMLTFNVNHNILFFRITSDLVPFASHPVCQFDWLKYFRDQLTAIGAFIRSNDVRISMHPGQYTVLNSPDAGIPERTIKELRYHGDVLDALDLDVSAKVQIHVGGVYGDKNESLGRFIQRYRDLDEVFKRRLVIENDDRNYTVHDCMRIYAETGVPVLFDVFHHELNHSGSSGAKTLAEITTTWQEHDGIPMVDYSSYHSSGGRKVGHTESIDSSHFERFLAATQPYDIDIMLEIKDKEASALTAVEIARKDRRFFHAQNRR
jgi:UV DNA damage endonuclease